MDVSWAWLLRAVNGSLRSVCENTMSAGEWRRTETSTNQRPGSSTKAPPPRLAAVLRLEQTWTGASPLTLICILMGFQRLLLVAADVSVLLQQEDAHHHHHHLQAHRSSSNKHHRHQFKVGSRLHGNTPAFRVKAVLFCVPGRTPAAVPRLTTGPKRKRGVLEAFTRL